MTDQFSISFQEDGSPFSNKFNDIYFDTFDGYQQSEAVFIQGSGLKERFEKLAAKIELTIAETGFGTGLNFLLTLKYYQEAMAGRAIKDWPVVTFISTEKYPLTKAQLVKSLAILPKLAIWAKPLIEQYPDETVNTASLNFFDEKVKLELHFNDATTAFSQLISPKLGLVDAWFLDGFSPTKNPDMWSNALFLQIARLSKIQATVSTFTVAGFVKRGLSEVGFRLEKKTIDCKKAECLIGKYQAPLQSGKGYQLRPIITKPQHVAIIGGGIASACAAYLLTKNGIKVTLYCKDESLAQGASSNAIGALYPLIHQKKDEISNFYEQAFWRAISLYKEVYQQGFHYDHDWCGLLEISYKMPLEKRQQFFAENNVWPDKLIHSIDNEQASKLAGITLPHGGLFMPKAGWIAPQELVKQLFNAAKTTGRFRLKNQTKINKLTFLDKGENTQWQLSSNKGDFIESIVIYCGGAESIDLEMAKSLPLTSTRGQVTSMKTNNTISNLSTVICHKGYLTPKNNNVHCIGATFEKNSHNQEANIVDDRYNLAMLEKCLPDLVNWQEKDIVSSKARLRCMTPDHLPLVGPMPDINDHKESYSHLSKDKNWRYHQAPKVVDNLYIMTGFGARGLCSAPLAADILLADLCGTPYPVDNNRLFSLSPNRFVIRDIVRRKFN